MTISPEQLTDSEKVRRELQLALDAATTTEERERIAAQLREAEEAHQNMFLDYTEQCRQACLKNSMSRFFR